MIPEPDKLNGLFTRLMLPEALIMAIRSLPPVKPRVQFLTREYLLQLQRKWELLYEFGRFNLQEMTSVGLIGSHMRDHFKKKRTW